MSYQWRRATLKINRPLQRHLHGWLGGEIRPGNKVIIGEELVNNASTTETLISLVEDQGGEVIAITCAINRSYPFFDTFKTAAGKTIPIISVIEKSTPQYRQDDPLVAEAIATGNIVWKPKQEWHKLKLAMDTYPQHHRET